MSEKTTLLPCPICGKKVSIARTENEVGERWWFITRGTRKTARCNCRLFLESEKFTCDWNDDYSLECRAKLVEKWNTRVTHGTLTAEQVRKAAKSNSRQYESPVDDGIWIREYDWQAIADELNACAERTCELNPHNDTYYRCSKCGLGIPKTHDGWWFYCPGCGCKVVNE